MRWFLIILLSSGSYTYAIENNTIERFSSKVALSNNSILCITQDTTGFLWIGSKYGLNKYDGSRVTHYYHDPNDSTSIADNYIQKLFVDTDGNLWVLVPQYFCRYDEERDRFVRYPYSDSKKNTHNANQGVIFEDARKNIWIGTPEMGMFYFEKSSQKMNRVLPDDENFNNMIFDNQGRLWIGSLGKIYIYNTDNHHYQKIDMPYYETVVSIDLENNYILTQKHFYSFYIENETIHLKEIEKDKQSPNEVLCAMETSGLIWLGSKSEGLVVFDKKDRHIKSFRFDSNNPNTLSNNIVRCLFEDKSGIIWIGTDDGLNRYASHRNLFISHIHYFERNSLISNTLTGFCEDDHHRLWISTYDGVSCWNREKDHYINYSSVPINGKQTIFQNIREISKDKNGNMWFALRTGLFKYRSDIDKFYFYPLVFEQHRGDDLLCSFVDRENTIWTGTYGSGIYRIDCSTGTVMQALLTDNSELSSNFIKDIIQLENGQFCFATLRSGIDIYDPMTATFKNIGFSRYTNNRESDYINHVFQDSNGLLWVASWHGLFLLDKNFEIVRIFTVDDGMPANEITSIIETGDNVFWIGSINGVARISILNNNNFHISIYTVNDGLSSNNICTGGTYLAHDSTLFLGSYNGFISFKPNDIHINNYSKSPIITYVEILNKTIKPNERINGQIILNRQIHLQNVIRLNHKQKIISFGFSTLDYSQNKIIRYAHMLEGLDKDWVYSNNNINSASYSNLYPGKYTFKIKSENDDGVWSSETLLDMYISPPFWATWWAYCIYLILTALTVYAIVYFFLYQERLKQNLEMEKLQHEKENEINNIKIGFYTNISHDVRTPLTLIVGPLEHILSKEKLSESLKKQIVIIKDNASYLLSLINQLLDFRKIEIGKNSLKVSRYDFVLYLKNIFHAFQSYAKQHNIELKFISSMEKEWLWFDPQLMNKVFFNLLNNALKFTKEKGTVTLKLDDNDHEIVVQVIDTGIGIHPEHLDRIFDDFYQVYHDSGSIMNHYTSGSGFGLTIAKKYIELHSATIYVVSQPNEGSTFTVRLLKGNAHFEKSQIDDQTNQLPEINISGIPVCEKNVLKLQQNVTQPGTKKKSTILLVDDNPDIVRFITYCLEEHFIIYTASNGTDGLEIASNQIPDVIVSDIMMPGLDGFEFCKQLKENALTNHIPILFLTAKVSLEDTLKGLKLGACDYITKPFNEAILLSKIENLIRDRDLLQEKIKSHLLFSEWNREKIPEKSHLKSVDPFVEKITDFIKENIEHPDLSPEMVEDQFRMTKMQLYRKLKAVSGLSIVLIISQLKINKACELLHATDLNISEIAYKLGYSDPMYFSKAFKKHTGKSPVQYRKE